MIAAASEERFSGIKHDDRFPLAAINYCLDELQERSTGKASTHNELKPNGTPSLTPRRGQKIDIVAFYEKPWLRFGRILESIVAEAPLSWRTFHAAMPHWLQIKLWVGRTIRRELRPRILLYFPHHLSHASSAFFPSPFESAAILTIDGVGEWATGVIAQGTQHRIKILCEQRFPHSLGLFYTAMTTLCGFKANSGEYKLMGLAPFGEPRLIGRLLDEVIHVAADGSIRLNIRKYFRFTRELQMFSPDLERRLGGLRRNEDEPISDWHRDVAASAQEIISLAVVRQARHVINLTQSRNLCLAGGVALNCTANRRILEETDVENLFVQPAAGDAGGSLGAAWLAWHHALDQPRFPADTATDGQLNSMKPLDSMNGCQLGPCYSKAEVKTILASEGVPFEELPREQFEQLLADQLADGKVVAWFQGRMEFGPRALGNRSILADARWGKMQDIINAKVKFRESFRPLAPCVLAEHAYRFFELEPGESYPYMSVVAKAREFALPSGVAADHFVGKVRDLIPAVIHHDGTARIQTVDPQRFPGFYRLLLAFFERTHCPVLINTSLNVRGQPICCTPRDALGALATTELDGLAIEGLWVDRQRVPKGTWDRLARQVPKFSLD